LLQDLLGVLRFSDQPDGDCLHAHFAPHAFRIQRDGPDNAAPASPYPVR
jgi:hypothetical protein